MTNRPPTMDDVIAAIKDAEGHLEEYERVHEELDDGKEWAEIDNGFAPHAKHEPYEFWESYMTGMMHGHLKEIVILLQGVEGRADVYCSDKTKGSEEEKNDAN